MKLLPNDSRAMVSPRYRPLPPPPRGSTPRLACAVVQVPRPFRPEDEHASERLDVVGRKCLRRGGCPTRAAETSAGSRGRAGRATSSRRRQGAAAKPSPIIIMDEPARVAVWPFLPEATPDVRPCDHSIVEQSKVRKELWFLRPS